MSEACKRTFTIVLQAIMVARSVTKIPTCSSTDGMLCSHLLLHDPCYDYAHTQLIFCYLHACGAKGSELQHTDTLLQDSDFELHLIHKAVLQD